MQQQEQDWAALVAQPPDKVTTSSSSPTSSRAQVLAMAFPGLPDISQFRKLTLLKALASVDLKAVAPHFVEQHLGKRYTLSPLPDLAKAFAESSSTTPLAFILGETADPCEAIYELAERMSIGTKRLQFMCLGRGREEQAEELLKEGIQVSAIVSSSFWRTREDKTKCRALDKASHF